MSSFKFENKNSSNIIMSRVEYFKSAKLNAFRYGGYKAYNPVKAHYPQGDTNFWKNENEKYILLGEEATKKRKKQKEEDLKIERMKVLDKLIIAKEFQQIINLVINNNFTLTAQQALKLWNKIQASGKNIITITQNGQEQKVMLNNATQDFFMLLMINGTDFVNTTKWGSDTIADYLFSDIEKIVLEKLTKATKVMFNKDGQFFGRINTTSINLTDYQIYNQDEAYNSKILSKREHCLINALLKSGVEEEKVNEIKLMYEKGCNIKKKDLKEIAKMIGKNIKLYSMDEKVNNTKINIYKCDDTLKSITIEIAIYESHYFQYEKTKYSRYSIKHYNELKNVFDSKDIVRKEHGQYKYDNEGHKINSLSLVNILFKNGFFKKLDLVRFAEASQMVELRDRIYLGNIEKEQRLVEQKKGGVKAGTKTPPIFYADCETYVNPEHVIKHELQLLGVVSDKNDYVDILNVCDDAYQGANVNPEQMVINKFMDILTNNGKQDALCYFHNLKYDFNILIAGLNIKDICEKDNQLYSVKIIHKKRTIELRDSYKLVPFGLAKFQKEFGLKEEYGKKEAIAYEYYTRENNEQRINIEEYKKCLSYEEQDIFLNEIKTNGHNYEYDEDDNMFNPMEYYKEYLKLDCLVLKKGLQKFDSLIDEITKGQMSIYRCLTISSLTDKFMNVMGAYEDIYEMTGNLKAYVAKAVYGGRVCVNKKYKGKVINGEISDYDGVSLYPSAIRRLCRQFGLPTGKAKRYLKDEYENWEKMNYSVLTVKITKVNKTQQMPFIAHKTKDSIKYSNDAPESEIIIDSITLQDYIKFHQIEYEILDGVYWNNGFNKKMGDVIQGLFDERLKKKQSHTALANTLKLMLNSSYGKTIMKKCNTKTEIIPAEKRTKNKITGEWKVVSNKHFESYIYNNFNTIKSYRKMNDKNYVIEKICADRSYNRAHVGCAILSMSKRIMNEVFDIANTNNLPIYYTDTDSLHCNLKDVKTLEDKYEEEYDKKLNGKQLEQFHTDFDLKGAKGEIYATKSIFLGKKSYIDYLESKDENGETINGIHVRLKGITKEGLEHTAKEYEGGVFELFEDLAKGTSKSIILNPFNKDTNKNKVMFDFKNGEVSTRKEFVRTVKF